MIICALPFRSIVPKLPTVRARVHYGARSLDLTIPVEYCREFDITEGDVFTAEAQQEKGELLLKFRRVFRNK